MDDLVEEPTPGMPVSADDVERVLAEIRSADRKPKWQPNVELVLGTRRWRPPAVSADRSRLLYVCLLPELPRYVAERLQLAAKDGIQVTVALPISTLYSQSVVATLASVDADVMVIDDFRAARRYKRRHVLAAMADVEVPVDVTVRQSIGRVVSSRLDVGTKQERGKRFEGLLAFIFSQIGDLRVVERNYRNKTEELDIVLQIDSISNRAWHESGVPFIIVEAKNWKDKVPQTVVSTLITKLQTKRSTAKIALLVSMGGFTEDARLQELRFSAQKLCVAMIDKSDVLTLIEADDLDDQLEVLVRRALLR